MKKLTSDGLPGRVFVVTAAGGFVVALDLSVVNVAFPAIERSFPGTSTATLSWVLSAYSLVFAALLLGAGRIADRSGRRASFLWGMAVFGIGSALCGVAPAAWVLIAGRAVQAAGAALLLPASVALLLAAAPPAARVPVVAMLGGVTALAVAAGPSLGALLIEAGGWRMAFFVNLPVVLVACVTVRRSVPESSVGGAFPDLAGMALVCGSMGALALGITQGGAWGWSSWRIVAAFVVAAILGPIGVYRSAHHPSPALDLRIFESRTVALANVATLLYSIGFFALLLASVLFLTRVWHYSTLRAGLAITPSPIVVAVLSARFGRLAKRIGYRPVLVTGGATLATGLLWYATVVGPEPHYLSQWLPGALLVGLGVALSFPVLSAAAVAGLPPERFALGSAANQTARQLGAVLGIALLVAVLGSHTSAAGELAAFRHAWLMCAAAAVASGAVSALQRQGATTAAEPAVDVPLAVHGAVA